MTAERVRWWGDPPNTYNKPYDEEPKTRRIKSGVYGLQRSLDRVGAKCYIHGRYDETTRRAVAYFQGSISDGLREDGIFGQSTARALFSMLCDEWEMKAGLPGPYLKGYCAHEGVWDMAALGPNLKDTGLMQINRGVFGLSVRLIDACSPIYSLTWATNRLVARYNKYLNWDAAIVGHRSPAWADMWVGLKPWPVGYFDAKKQITHQEAAIKYVTDIKLGG